MKRIPSPSGDSSLGVPEFPEKSCQNNWNPHAGKIQCSSYAHGSRCVSKPLRRRAGISDTWTGPIAIH